MMKRFVLAEILFLTILFTSCDNNNNCILTPSVQSGEVCIDSTLINDSIVCIEIYDPVCGCDGNTYANYCIANRSGVISYIGGACCD